MGEVQEGKIGRRGETNTFESRFYCEENQDFQKIYELNNLFFL
jgi:hypothetical protein